MNMKKILLTIIFFSLQFSFNAIMAQPSPVKKAAKGILKITTFSADGNVLSTGYGAFIDTDGTAIAAWTPFVGASTAVAIDGQGTKYEVESIIGASAIYNVTKLKVKLPQKPSIQPLAIEKGQQATGTNIWCVEYDVKTPAFHKFMTSNIETFMNDMPYYIFEQETAKLNENNIGAPFLNAQGELMGLLSTSSTRTDLYCAAARYAITLQPTALSGSDNVLRNTNMRIALPKDYNQALLALIVAANAKDSIKYPAMIDEFNSLFPDKEDGYLYKATYLTDKKDFAGAEQAMAKALEISQNKDNVHYSYSKLIFDKELMMTDTPYPSWSLDKALNEVDEAININSLPLYHIHKGKIFYSQEKYQDALNEFIGVTTSDFRDADVYYFAYQCMKSLNMDRTKQLEMLDSATTIAPNQVLYKSEQALLMLKMRKVKEALIVCQSIVSQYPYYGEGHGLMGLALCMAGQKATGVAELKRAKAMGYQLADSFIEKYGQEDNTPQPETTEKKKK